jgi:energy-coupling factor transport system ATP-binding protein
VLVAENVGFAYSGGKQVLAHVGFSISAGRFAAIAGRNGAGKSTLLRLCNGLLKPTTGRVLIDGVDTRSVPASKLARVVGTVFQSPEQQIFNSHVTDEVSFGPRQLGLNRRQVEQRVKEALARTRLEDVASAHPLDLDRTTRRFVAVASALAMKPRLLLLDESQQGMDAIALRRLEMLLRAEKAAGVAVVFVCHDMEFIARNADEVLVFHGGHLLAGGSPLGIFSSSAVLEEAGLAAPESLALSSRLGLPPALSPEQMATAWLRHLSMTYPPPYREFE